MLVSGLVEQGHDVTLFAHAQSQVPCRLFPYPCVEKNGKADVIQNMWYVSSKILKESYDLIHSFGRLAYLLPLLPSRLPKLMSYQRTITKRSIVWAERLARGTIHFSGCSRFMIEPYSTSMNWHVVYNGVPIHKYQFFGKVSHDAPLVFLGRIEKIKGPHLAIKVAQKSGRRLIIAGNIPEDIKHKTYFQEQIEPHIDGKTIHYIGSVDDSQKNALLGNAVALLMPILWEEPFGIVMAEALACGTPVIGFKRGAVPEVVQNEVNGFLCESVEEMIHMAKRIDEIDRAACRRIMEEKFSDVSILDSYLNLYDLLCSY
ncbi:MAG: glycosyltransferase [Chlamydiae bacterium]|nr:glycosyltransferase [Chlamydiota bacterium]